MDFERSFRYILDDQEWYIKIGIGALLALSGIGLFAVLGWSMEIMRRVAAEEEDLLPDWTAIGDYFILGLKYSALGLVWMMPVLLFSICGSILVGVGAGHFADSADAAAFASIFSICMFGLVIVNMLVMLFLAPPAMVLLAQGADYKSLFNPRTLLHFTRANLGGYLIANIVGYLLTMILGAAGIIECIVGSYFGFAFGYAVWAYLNGAAHRDAMQNLTDSELAAA